MDEISTRRQKVNDRLLVGTIIAGAVLFRYLNIDPFEVLGLR